MMMRHDLRGDEAMAKSHGHACAAAACPRSTPCSASGLQPALLPFRGKAKVGNNGAGGMAGRITVTGRQVLAQ